MKTLLWLLTLIAVATTGAAVWMKAPQLQLPADTDVPAVPSTTVKRGDVVVTVTARGELQGGNSEMLTVPSAGGGDVAITSLKGAGELVKPGEVVAQLDTTEQEFRMREAEADYAEAEQQVLQSEAEAIAKEEETRYQLLQAQADVKLAELDVRRNELLPSMVQKQNDLAQAAARDRLRQIERDSGSRQATAAAGVAMQKAVLEKARLRRDTAKNNIDQLTLKAKSEGYVALMSNSDGNFMWGSLLPVYKVGDVVRAGVAIAQIPDLKNWDVQTRIGELDRGHLAEGQLAEIAVLALPGRKFQGKVKNIGGTQGPPWDRRFECKISIDNPAPEMRPGMSTSVKVTTQSMRDVLWIPSQALFESDGRKFVYLNTPSGFTPKDVKLVRRSEAQVVIEGLEKGQTVALANPEQSIKKANKPTGGATSVLPGKTT
jgi:multidrug efflux pump subunit AcrA (membrane-fusion protein)